MSENFWRRINYIAGLLPIGALFGLAAYVANVEVRDLDLWLHIASGRFITNNHFISPAVDFLSHTISGQTWINHEWLFQVLVFHLFDHFGPDGILMMQKIVVIATMLLLLFLGYNRDRQLMTTFTLCIVYLVYQQRFTTRPELFSLLFFTIYIFILAFHIDKKWSIIILFIVQVFWSNMFYFEFINLREQNALAFSRRVFLVKLF